MCLPDGTVQVTNPNVGLYSHVFAVQDEGVSAAVKCTVSTSGAQSNITGCSQVSYTDPHFQRKMFQEYNFNYKRGFAKIIVPFRGYGRNSANQVMIKRE